MPRCARSGAQCGYFHSDNTKEEASLSFRKDIVFDKKRMGSDLSRSAPLVSPGLLVSISFLAITAIVNLGVIPSAGSGCGGVLCALSCFVLSP